ncbi:MAG TPA: FAD-binding oxidoreductase [Candidatus Saccharimonadales bacterium]|nr:FAD-binding oxidoreductase [Candidatus Saccharimonadales bacterium]
MSKVAEYLQEHIAGEISSQPTVLDAMSHDASILEIRPEMVIYPRVTSDIRKVARFSWQLAEKGHTLPLTARGGGTDTTGAAIGKGIVINSSAHMNAILEFDPKQKLIRVQPGLSAKGLNDALALHGMSIPALPPLTTSTIGGAVANNSYGMLSGQFGDMHTWTHQLEVVLANGDVLQTERISKRELSRRKGLQTFEGEIYRTIDNLIEDNQQLITEKLTDNYDASGYSAIARVKQRDGSFDLTPLFIGSQGTLGIISEMIVRADFVGSAMAVAAAAFPSKEIARDTLDQLKKFEPALLDYIDGEFYEAAAARGKKYSFCRDITVGAVIVIGFADFSERARRKKLKKIEKYLSQVEASFELADGNDAELLLAAREATFFTALPNQTGASTPPLFDGAYVPPERFEDFSRAVASLATKYHVALPLHLNALDNLIYTRPILQLHKVSEKQKVIKLIDEFTALVTNSNGCLVAQGGEGRVKAKFALESLDEDVKELFAAIKTTFDPYNTLNPGVKQPVDVRQLANQFRKDYDSAAFANQTPLI